MKADEGKVIKRTVGDTDPILVKLRRRGDAGEAPIGNAAGVTLRVRTGSGVIDILGQSRNVGDGVFGFNPEDLPDVASTLKFSIIVSDAGETYTIARGTIEIAAH